MSAISSLSSFGALPQGFAASLPLKPKPDQETQQALNTLEAINDPKAKFASARERTKQEVSLATEKLNALQLLGVDDGRAAANILKALDRSASRYADAASSLGKAGQAGSVTDDFTLTRENAQITGDLSAATARARTLVDVSEDDQAKQDAARSSASIRRFIEDASASIRTIPLDAQV